MAQNREKDETLDLKVPSETPLSIPSCPDNCKKIPSSSTSSSRPDLARVGPEIADMARPNLSIDVQQDKGQIQEQKRAVEKTASLKRPASSIGPDVGPESLGLARPDVKAAVNSGKRGVNRCFGCGKRVGLTGFRCRCGDLFCGEHRYSDRHDCSYDYKSAGREAIARENPVIRAAKILKL